MKLIGEALRTTVALKNKYTTEVYEKVLKPVDDFLKTDLREFKESKKTFDKALEKYESTLAKYNGQSRQKEPSALREEAFQLYDTRKAYIQAAMTCSMLCIKFQDSLDQLILGVFLDLVATQHDYFSGNSDHFASMALHVLQLKTYMKGHKEASAFTLTELEQNKDRYIADAIEYWKPSRSLKSYTNTIPVSKSTASHSATLGAGMTALNGTQPSLSSLSSKSATISSSSSSSRPTVQTTQFLGAAPPSSGGPNSSQSQDSNSGSQVDLLSAHSGEDGYLKPTITPNSSSTLSVNQTPSISASTSLTNVSSLLGTSDNYTPTTKQGYLNIRIPQPKNRAPVWQRKYFFIQEGEFGFESVVSNPTVGSQVVQSERIAVLLCEVRYGSSSNSLMTLNGGGNPASGTQGLAMVQMERRFCFEVVCATQSYLLQAETEEDLMSWVNTFEVAKRNVLLQQRAPRSPEPEEPYSPVPDSANRPFSFSAQDLFESQTGRVTEESEATKSTGLGLGWAANVPGVSLLLSSYTGGNNSSTTPKGSSDGESSGLGTDTVGTSGDEADQQEAKDSTGGSQLDSSAYKEALTQSLSVSQRPENSPVPSCSEVIQGGSARPPVEITVNTALLSGQSQQRSEIEKLMTSALHIVPKTQHISVTDIPHYPMELVVRNRELHLRFHGTKVHSKEYVLHSWTSAYLDDSRPGKPIMVYGRISLTQSGMYFYARDLSVETKRMYRFSVIRGIECEQKDISTEWRIETVDGVQHIFSQFALNDTEYQVLHLIWTNAHQTSDRLPVKELFRRTMLISNKPKGSAGSGSLAETESSHLTSRDGTMTHHSGQDNLVAGGPEFVPSPGGPEDKDWINADAPDESFPADVELPAGPVDCKCSGHLEKVELEQTFKLPAKTLNRLLFGNNSPIWKEFHERRNNTIQNIGEWRMAAGQKTRTIKFLMVVNNPIVKLNQTDCAETHTCEVEEDHLRYSYTVKSSVPAMPYSDAFTPVLRYCITFVSKGECKLTCSSAIEWHKNPLVKAMIKGAIIKGTAETVRDVAEIIQLHLERLKGGALASKTTPATVVALNDAGFGQHQRASSANVLISLHGPDNASQSILYDPQHGQNGPDVQSGAQGRAPGGRRHTVSAGSAAAGGAIIPGSGPRVQGQWPTGAPPTFVPIGSKASRTRLLGKPSRAMLLEQSVPETTVNQELSSRQTGMQAWIRKHILGQGHPKEGWNPLARALCVFLVLSSLINIWAAFNSQRMLDSTWRLWQHQNTVYHGPLRGYSEPLNRVLHGHHSGENLNEPRNIRVAARAVFLKDLEEQMMKETLEEFRENGSIDPTTLEVFLEVRGSFRAWPKLPLEWYPGMSCTTNKQSTEEATTPEITSIDPPQATLSPRLSEMTDDSVVAAPAEFPWFMTKHRRMATRIIFQRDRVGILRHDLLVAFEVLKQLEKRLLDTEFVNWVMDERSRCRLWERKRKGAQVSSPASHKDSKQTWLTFHKNQTQVREDFQDGTEEETGQERQQQQTQREEATLEFCQSLEYQVGLFMLDAQRR
ncbi:SNF1-interacting protein [Lunasporangiospora selenospora]|uniref:SNF1-interacting protein n=1 Tax=Lunasporangiospora selenospora TaxID=979761 RepID=A0A9P6KDF6_9FUNG|nr:SNF1-interacting protein [Lunasporangiospora selenospora]